LWEDISKDVSVVVTDIFKNSEDEGNRRVVVVLESQMKWGLTIEIRLKKHVYILFEIRIFFYFAK